MSIEQPNKAERARLIHHAQMTLRALEALPALTPCAECLEFDAGFCRRWKAQVPPEAQPAGCDQWQEQIPF